MSVNKGLIAGTVVVGLGLSVGIGWWLARAYDARRDAELFWAERAVKQEAMAKAAESYRKGMEEARANDAREKAASDARKQQYDAQHAKDRERLAEAQAYMAANEKLPRQRGLKYLQAGDWKQLDELVDSLAASGERAPNGQFQLHLVTSGIDLLIDRMEESDESLQKRIAAYQRERPESAFAPILSAMQWHNAAWRARGDGYASDVTPEGWTLFRERNREAWHQILIARLRGDRLPTWYSEAIAIGLDAHIEREQLQQVFEQGIARFPGYHTIYFAFMRQFVPRWGGSYAESDAFIREQVAAGTNPEGEILYTRLYWKLDSMELYQLNFFEESRVDWRRMRAGFEALVQKYPEKANRAVFANYACRAGDGPRYLKLRKELTDEDFRVVPAQGVSLEVCDERFLVKT
jgi:hypothetical protein